MSHEPSSISITRHIAGAKTLAWGFLLGAAQGAAILSLGLLAASGLDYGPGVFSAFWAVLLLAWGIGAWWWGRAIDGESSLAPRLLAVTQILAAFYWLLWPWLLSFCGWLGAVLYPWDRPEPGLLPLLAQALALAPLLVPAAFFCGGALPLLAETGLKKRRLLEWNLPLIGGSRLLGLAGGFAVATFAPLKSSEVLWGALGFNILIALVILLTADRPESDGYEGEAGARLWPSHALGLWSGEAINVLDHDLTRTAARPAWLVTFLSTLTVCGSLSLWAGHFGFIGVRAAYDANFWWVYLPALMALGGLILAPQLSRWGSPSTVLALAGFLAALGLLFAPWLLGRLAPVPADANFWARPEFLAFLWPGAVLGTLWPLAGQVFQSRRHWLASSLGLASFWGCLGGAAGLLLTAAGLLDFHQAAAVYFAAAWLAAFLATSPLIGHLAAVGLWLVSLLILFFVTA